MTCQQLPEHLAVILPIILYMFPAAIGLVRRSRQHPSRMMQTLLGRRKQPNWPVRLQVGSSFLDCMQSAYLSAVHALHALLAYSGFADWPSHSQTREQRRRREATVPSMPKGSVLIIFFSPTATRPSHRPSMAIALPHPLTNQSLVPKGYRPHHPYYPHPESPSESQ